MRYNRIILRVVLSGMCTAELPGEPSKKKKKGPVLATPRDGDSASWGVAQNDCPFGKPSKEGPGSQWPEEWVFREPQDVFRTVMLRI